MSHLVKALWDKLWFVNMGYTNKIWLIDWPRAPFCLRFSCTPSVCSALSTLTSPSLDFLDPHCLPQLQLEAINLFTTIYLLCSCSALWVRLNQIITDRWSKRQWRTKRAVGIYNLKKWNRCHIRWPQNLQLCVHNISLYVTQLFFTTFHLSRWNKKEVIVLHPWKWR